MNDGAAKIGKGIAYGFLGLSALELIQLGIRMGVADIKYIGNKIGGNKNEKKSRRKGRKRK